MSTQIEESEIKVPVEAADEKFKNVEKTKKRNRKKIRRLADVKESEKFKNTKLNKCKRVLVTSSLIIFAISLFMGHYFIKNNGNQNQILKEFLKNYRNQYTQIIHGKSNYCDQTQNVDLGKLFERIKQNQILHQERAMHQIEIALRNESNLNAIALIGPPGVGKSLFVRALQQNFPWQENVHAYSWKTYVDDEAKKFHLIRILIEKLSECGQNLLIIENLQPCDHGAVDIINNLVIEANKDQHKRVVLFYVFSLNTMLTPDEYEKQKDVLQSLSNCSVINFKPFSKIELKDCVQREAEIEGLTLSNSDFHEIVSTIEPFKSGCKNVNAKVLMYGTVKTKKFF